MAQGYRSVLVSHKKPDISGSTFGTSGILLRSGWILTHGSLLSPNFFNEKSTHEVRDFLVGRQNQLEHDLLAISRKVADTVEFRVHLNKTTNKNEKELRESRVKMTEEKDCTLKFAWRCTLLRKTINDLLFSWSFEKIAKFDKSLLPIFLMLRIDNDLEPGGHMESAKAVLRELSEILVELSPINRGSGVEIESAPFGNSCFLNSVSRGIVSNVLGEGNCIILSDVNAVPGCEGAPLFLLPESCGAKRRQEQLGEARRICGLVVAPLSWCRGEWVDFTFAANLSACLRNLLDTSDKRCDVVKDTIVAVANCATMPTPLSPDHLDKSVVLVKCGSDWGTGVIVDAASGILLTCSHVVSKAADSIDEPRVRVRLANGREEAWARVVYRSHGEQQQPYDVAVLKLLQRPATEARNLMQELRLATRNPIKGSSVLIWGYPLLGSDASPSCSRGIVSRVSDCVIQTTCCVQSGSSGGPVIDSISGDLLGIVVSNAIVSSNLHPRNRPHTSASPFSYSDSVAEGSRLYPRFNMAVPIASVIRKPLLRYLATGDERCLESLTTDDPIVRETWNFHLTPQSKM